MKRILKMMLATMVLTVLSAMPAFAAAPQTTQVPQATMKIMVEIDGQDFWNCSFYTKDNDPVKPAAIKVDWSIGNMGRDAKAETIILPGKTSGQATITTDKGELVNVQVTVRGPKNQYLGSWGMQSVNKGQTETITIYKPMEVLPEFTRSNI